MVDIRIGQDTFKQFEFTHIWGMGTPSMVGLVTGEGDDGVAVAKTQNKQSSWFPISPYFKLFLAKGEF